MKFVEIIECGPKKKINYNRLNIVETSSVARDKPTFQRYTSWKAGIMYHQHGATDLWRHWREISRAFLLWGADPADTQTCSAFKVPHSAPVTHLPSGWETLSTISVCWPKKDPSYHQQHQSTSNIADLTSSCWNMTTPESHPAATAVRARKHKHFLALTIKCRSNKTSTIITKQQRTWMSGVACSNEKFSGMDSSPWIKTDCCQSFKWGRLYLLDEDEGVCGGEWM